MARTKAQRERDRLEGAYARQRQRLEDEARSSLVTVCDRHGWRVAVPPGRPAPLATECEGCKLDAMGSRPETFETRTLSLADLTGETPSMALRWERHREQQKEVRPGSLEEQQALASIDTAREEEIRREEARGRGLLQGAQFVSHRYSGGHLTEIYRVARGRFAEVS